MVSVNSLAEISKFVQQNELKIKILEEINELLRERHNIKAEYTSVSNQFKDLKNSEDQRKNQYNREKKNELVDLEHQADHLCQEHAKILHQIEHINWHLDHAHPHAIAPPLEHPHVFSKKCHTTSTAMLHSQSHSNLLSNKSSSNTGYLQISAERYIKTLAELRRKICMTKMNLEQEIERKRVAEKNLSDLRKDISKQKKLMSAKRSVPLPTITAVKKCVK